MKEFFHVVDLDEARSRAGGFGVVSTETVPLDLANGRVLAADFVAESDLPGFARSTMDGFAVRASSTFGASDSSPAFLEVVGEVVMGRTSDVEVGAGKAVRILTGGMLPSGADAVVMVEHTERIDDGSIEVTRSVAPGQNVVSPDEDVRSGEVLIEAGARLRPQETGLLAALGVTTPLVFRRPVVAILSTGDEIVSADRNPGPGQVRDVNSHTLAGMVERAGGSARSLGIVRDDFDGLLRSARDALSSSDVVVLSGGSSVGSRDLTLEVLGALPDSRILFHGVAIKPGKPTILADVGGKAFWGLPGHVTSAMVVFHVLVRRQVLSAGGVREVEAITVPARLSRNVASAHGRRDFVRVRLEAREEGYLAVPVLGKSGLIRTMVEADGLVEIDRDTEGLDADATVRVELF
jgi:molybdopterin molybdotransferase